MKKILLFMFFSISAFAAEKNEISDLMYLPPGEDFYFDFNYTSIVVEADIFSGASKFAISKTELANLNLEAGYGFTDRFAISLELSQTASMKSTTTIVATNTDSVDESAGMSDPYLGIKYRLVSGVFNIDVGLKYKPKIGDNKEATATSDGTVASGGDAKVATLDLGLKSGMHSFALLAEYETEGDREELENDGSALRTTTTGGESLSIEAAYSISFGAPSVVLYYILIDNAESKEKEASTGLVDTTEKSSFSSFGARFNYNFADSFMLYAGYGLSRTDDFELGSLTVKNYESTEYLAGLLLQF